MSEKRNLATKKTFVFVFVFALAFCFDLYPYSYLIMDLYLL